MFLKLVQINYIFSVNVGILYYYAYVYIYQNLYFSEYANYANFDKRNKLRKNMA